MRKFLLILTFLLFACFVLFGLIRNKSANFGTEDTQGVLSDKVTVANSWFPKSENDANLSDVSVGASASILVNYDTGEVLQAKNSSQRLPGASTIKIMTALVALEHAELDDIYAVSANASKIGEDSMGLSEGENLSMEDLLYGLMLLSGNDAAVTLAEGIARSEDAFVAMMNLKSKELGLADTKFINVTGLDVDEEIQFTTAHDLATLARYTWDKYPAFRKIAATDHIFIDANASHKAFDMYNVTNLLTSYPGVKGIKPGFTWEAGYCLVTYAENNNVKLIGVLLNSPDRRGEMTRLLDAGFAKYQVKVEHPQLAL